MPRFTAVTLIITLSSIGLPGMNGFIGEFLIMLGAFKWDPRFVVIAALGVILSAVYMLWMFQRVFYGKVTNDHNKGLPDLSFREWAIVGPLAAAAIGMGVVPNVFLKPMEPAVQRLVDRVQSRQPLRGRRRRGAAEVDASRSRRLPMPAKPKADPAQTCRTSRPQDLEACGRSGGDRDDQRSIRRRHPDALRDAGGPRRPARGGVPRRDEKMPIGGLAIIGLLGAGVASILLWDSDAESFGVVTADNFGLFVNLVLVVVGILTVDVLVADGRARSAAGRRVLRDACCSPSSA